MNPDRPRFWPPNPGHSPEGSQPEVRTRVDGEHFLHQFNLVSERVGYRFQLFRARHGLGFPVTIFDGPEGTGTEDDVECETAERLEQVLKELFEHPATQQIVGQLRSLSRKAG